MMASVHGALFRGCCCHSDGDDANDGASAHNADASAPAAQRVAAQTDAQQQSSSPSSKAEASMGGVGASEEEEESHLLKEKRSSSLKTETYSKIWQRRSVWIRHSALHSFEIRNVEFWSGWRQQRPSSADAAVSEEKNSKESPASTGVVDKTAVRRRNFPQYSLTSELSIESLKPELYTRTSLDSVEGWNGTNEADNDTDTSFLFGSPSSSPLGFIHFSLTYDEQKKTLIVKIIEAAHLPPPSPPPPSPLPPSTTTTITTTTTTTTSTTNTTSSSSSTNRKDPPQSNPYVRVYLLPDQRDSRQTLIQRKTQSPVFNESFSYTLDYREVSRRHLMLKVHDVNRSAALPSSSPASCHQLIGQVVFPLADINLLKGVHVWKRIKPPCQDFSLELGEILLSVAYLPSAKRLNLDLLRAKQLLQTNVTAKSAPYVQVSLVVAGKHIKTKKSSRKKDTINPAWGEIISFNIAAAELNESSLVISVWDYNSMIGRIVMGKDSTGDEEACQWSCILQEDRTSNAQWHTLRLKEYCDQVSKVSALIP